MFQDGVEERTQNNQTTTMNCHVNNVERERNSSVNPKNNEHTMELSATYAQNVNHKQKNLSDKGANVDTDINASVMYQSWNQPSIRHLFVHMIVATSIAQSAMNM